MVLAKLISIFCLVRPHLTLVNLEGSTQSLISWIDLLQDISLIAMAEILWALLV